jgi:hypothetical protein
LISLAEELVEVVHVITSGKSEVGVMSAAASGVPPPDSVSCGRAKVYAAGGAVPVTRNTK